MVVVDLTLATICFLGQCHPALVGQHTPAGTFELALRATDEPGYGGDVLAFKEDRTRLWAVHRVWTLEPRERRLERLRAGDPRLRRGVTRGCVNVAPAVYDALVACCAGDVLEVRP